ncbi:MAG: glycoside hydrolase family 3 C-terminal domain-containing protein [Lachnospiraceae bacterium]|nr:glycoside hydrolase family 3 C-terminal domain-containing protein [Lachnospiraceae bacterium]
MNKTLDWMEYAKTARQMVAEGCVLVKNDDKALPLIKGERISIFGRIQSDYYKSGTGSGGMVNTPYVVSIPEGLKHSGTVTINEELVSIYDEWKKKNPFDQGVGWAQEPWCQKEMPLTDEVVMEAAGKSDAALIIIGRTAGEDKDNSATQGSYLLTDEEEAMLSIVCQHFERTIVVLNVGNIIDMKWVDRFQPKAVLYTWQGGSEGGNGIADVLTGKVSPCGKLSDTIAFDIEDYPSTKDFGSEERNFYTEDIYVGYRYFETVAKEKVSYPFGFGLSYTEFEIQTYDFLHNDNQISFQVSVTNRGKTAGKEVVQVYYCPPQGLLGKPFKNLIRFEKTKELQPGESQSFSIEIRPEEMASYDDSGMTGHKSCYVLEAGEYQLYAGSSVRHTTIAGSIEIQELKITQKCQAACVPVIPFQRLRPQVQTDGRVIRNTEEVPLRAYDMAERIRENLPITLEQTGDKGIRLIDVKEGRASMKEFIAQLSNEDLIHISRAEGMCSAKATPGIAGAFGGVTESLKGFGIPVAGCSDGPSGIRMDCGTMAFSHPNGTLIACSFNKELTEELYELEALELRKNKIDTLLGPGINIHRNPLNGRNFEYFSEDPYLTGMMAAAQLKGMHKYGVTGTIKHFACNNQELGRHTADSVVSERALREIYLKGFEHCVKESGAYSIMSTYGPLNGIWTGSNYDLLTTILRREWGFDGIVMTDWWAKLNDEGSDGTRENTTAMVRAQNDLYMVCGDSKTNSNQDNTQEGLDSGTISRGELQRNAENICSVIMRFPIMDSFIGKEESIQEINVPESKKAPVILQPAAELMEQVELDVRALRTEAGSDNQYSIHIPERGPYTGTIRMRSDLGELAQISLSILLNNHLISSMTINGTKGEWIEKEFGFEVFIAVDNYLDFYFAQSGMEIEKISIRKQ